MTDVPRQRLVALPPVLKATCLKALLRQWICRARSRREISKLDERTILDLGLTPSQMQFEARKPFWRD